MAYRMTQKEMVMHLKEDAEYFPFEQIRDFKHLQKQPIDIAEDVKSDYLGFFKDVKKECERLLQTQPHNENSALWSEAIEEINKILNQRAE
ncbi:MAG: hypothetical protein IJC94_03625 [Oscillospiraceae bacterium]|nr:hypothetical protein [Oscillospiraceae bacterium]